MRGFMQKYFSEKNALTVMVAIFCFVMIWVSLAQTAPLWQTIAFILAFSMAVEVIGHRSREAGR